MPGSMGCTHGGRGRIHGPLGAGGGAGAGGRGTRVTGNGNASWRPRAREAGAGAGAGGTLSGSASCCGPRLPPAAAVELDGVWADAFIGWGPLMLGGPLLGRGPL